MQNSAVDSVGAVDSGTVVYDTSASAVYDTSARAVYDTSALDSVPLSTTVLSTTVPVKRIVIIGSGVSGLSLLSSLLQSTVLQNCI